MTTISKSSVSVGPVTSTSTDTRQNLTINGWRQGPLDGDGRASHP